MSRFLAVILVCIGIFCLTQSHAQVPLTGAGAGAPSSGGFSPSCSQSTNFLARTSGLTNGQKTNYDNFICGIETDGVGCSTTWDAIYVLWAPDATTSLLNLCSASFPLTVNGGITFAANQGYTGNGSTGYLDTGYQPLVSGSFFSTTSASLTVCVLTNRAVNQIYDAIGSDDTTLHAYYFLIRPLNSGNILWDLGNNIYPSAATANAQGMWSAYLTALASNALYKNNSSTAFGTDTHGINGALAYNTITIGASNQGPPGNFSTDTIGFASIGGGLSGANSALFATRVETFMTAVGQSGC